MDKGKVNYYLQSALVRVVQLTSPRKGDSKSKFD